MKLIERELYLNKLKAVQGTPDIKVITGVRRSGKSKLLEAFRDYVHSAEPEANIIHINFNLPEYDDLHTYKALYDYVKAHRSPTAQNYIFIDEVQLCTDFEKAINGLHVSEQYDIYITGSNAFLLSSDLATLFTGRTFEIKVYPFSFAEYIRYHGATELNSAFDAYMTEGGMAGAYLYKDLETKYDYINEVFNALIVRDIRQKYRIKHIALMDRLIDFLIGNISNISSVRNITDELNAAENVITNKTVANYIEYLCNAFAFYPIKRYDIQGKKYLSNSCKYYVSDHSFRYSRLGTKNMDYGRVLENIIAIELLRRGYEVYVGILYKKEIDFIAIKRNEKLYIQVSDNINDERTFQREVTPLLQIKDAYPKLLIARTWHETYQYEGIQIIDAARWLLGQ